MEQASLNTLQISDLASRPSVPVTWGTDHTGEMLISSVSLEACLFLCPRASFTKDVTHTSPGRDCMHQNLTHHSHQEIVRTWLKSYSKLTQTQVGEAWDLLT